MSAPEAWSPSTRCTMPLQQIVRQLRNFATLRKRAQEQEHVMKTNERFGIVELDLAHRRQ